jgi:hypothetical protein
MRTCWLRAVILVGFSALAAVSIGCQVTQPAPPPSAVCHPTIARMTPPSAPFEFFANGSSTPEAARVVLKTANWYGNDAMWVVLPPDGEIVGRLDDKIPPYRLKTGQVRYEALQLDGHGVVASAAIGAGGYGDIGFASGGPTFPTTGCWQVTYTLDGADPLRFVLRVR